MIGKRSERNLARLEETASTSRVMNFALIERTLGDDPKARRFFRSDALNKSIILKHTLRQHELELFGNTRRVGTKLIFPFDFRDLKLGGTSIFLNQRDFLKFFSEADNAALIPDQDMILLNLLDGLPSLDPFLVREHAARAGLPIATERLALSPADISAMQAFVHGEIRRLISVAFNTEEHSLTQRFANKILTNKPDDALRPLMDVFRMNQKEFWDGVFSWRGFLYYKWRLEDMLPESEGLIKAVNSYVPSGGADPNLSAYITEARPKVHRKYIAATGDVQRTINVYNTAFSAMVQQNDASKFKQFLFDGPNLFLSLGEKIGLLDHFISLWKFRHREGAGRMSALEYADFLVDLDESLTIASKKTRGAA